jgi:hypothetical protein
LLNLFDPFCDQVLKIGNKFSISRSKLKVAVTILDLAIFVWLAELYSTCQRFHRIRKITCEPMDDTLKFSTLLFITFSPIYDVVTER